METSANLALPYILPSQAQKHVTHNEAISMLDALVQLSVIDRDLTAPPGGEANGDRYIVAASASGGWAGKEDSIAVMQDGGWVFLTPVTGWVAWITDEAQLCYWTGAAWASVAGSITALQDLSLLGLGTTADATNPFSAKLNKALWTAKTLAEGGDGDLRYTLNKETAGDVNSLLFQSGFSGRAEIGLIGDDDLAFRTSPDGANWFTPLLVDKDHGKVRIGGGSTSFGALNILGKNPYAAGGGYQGICFTNTETDLSGKGGVVVSAAPFDNSHSPWTALGVYADSSFSFVYYGGGSWGIPEASAHYFYAGAHLPDTANGSTLAFVVGDGALLAYRNIQPGADNTHSLGGASLRWTEVYAATGTINTSDGRLKDIEGPVPLGLDFVSQLRPVAYKWKVGGHDIERHMVEPPAERQEVGPVAKDFPVARAGTRTHYGLVAQDVKALLDARGLDFAGWTLADKHDPDSDQGLRYDQFVPILVRAVQELAARVDQLEAANG